MFQVATGSLPAGLSLSPEGSLSGTPTAEGDFSFSITAQDDNGFAAEQPYTLHISGDTTPPVITPTVTGTLGKNGWYVSNVEIVWTVEDPDSAIDSSSGCETTTLATDTGPAA